MKKILSQVLVLTLLFTLLMPAFALADAANDTLIYAIDGDPGSDINTITTSGRFDLMAERMLYSTLYDYYGPDDIEYMLAESIEVSEDNMVVTAHLRQNVLWSDGVPFTADDVIFTYEKIIEFDYANGHSSFVYDGVPVGLVKVDDYTVEFHMPVYVGAVLEALTAEHYIMPKHIYEGDATLDNNAKNATPVGTGPFILAEYQAGQYMKFSANPNYFLGAPKIGTVIFQFVSDASSAALSLKKGEINAMVIANSAAEDFADADVTIYAYPEDRVGYASFVMGSDRVQDVNFRKACFFAFNRTEMNIGAYLSEEYYRDAKSFLPYTSAYFTEDLETYAQNVETAKQYLALCSAVPVVRIAYTANNVQQEVQAMVMQQNLKAIGVTAELVAIDSGTLYDKLQDNTGDFEIFLGGYIMGVDPSNYACLFTSGSASNYSFMADETLDALFLAGSTESDPAARAEIYKQAQQHLADLAIFYPIVTNSRLLAVTNDVKGIEDARLIPIYTFQNMAWLYFED